MTAAARQSTDGLARGEPLLQAQRPWPATRAPAHDVGQRLHEDRSVDAPAGNPLHDRPAGRDDGEPPASLGPLDQLVQMRVGVAGADGLGGGRGRLHQTG